MSGSAPAALSDLPPSAKLIHKTLEYEGECTQQEIAAETKLADRTVRSALLRLTKAELVEKKIDVRNARRRLYVLRE